MEVQTRGTAAYGAIAESLGADTARVVWRFGPETSLSLRRQGLIAATFGQTVYVDGLLAFEDPKTIRGIVSHELVHVLQQTEGARWTRHDDSPAALEAEADQLGRLAVSGCTLPPRRRDGDTLPPRVQGHDSFEHRLLGDTPTDLLIPLVAGKITPEAREQALTRECALLEYLGTNPTNIDPMRVRVLYGGNPVNLVTLKESGLTLTYGELNTLADFLNSPEQIDSLPLPILLPILQMIRYSGWKHMNSLRHSPDPAKVFIDALTGFCPGSVASILETKAFDLLTTGLGLSGRDHYQGTLARNACHFAPFTWWRWQASYSVAVKAAQAAYKANKDPELVRQAWVAHGYADHFLQDSFAAGHLFNKQLIMQWFLEWAAEPADPGARPPVGDWDTFKTLTTTNQPGLAGRDLYNPRYLEISSGLSTDPQTTEEQPTKKERIANTHLIAAGGLSQEQAYQAYLAWLDSAVCQIVTSQLHDLLNERSVMAEAANGFQGECWGDDAMLNGGYGAEWASMAAQMSQRSIRDILETGGSDTQWQNIFAWFPRKVQSNNAWVDLEQWHARGGELWNLCRSNDVFDSWKTLFVGAGSHLLNLGIVSVDQAS